MQALEPEVGQNVAQRQRARTAGGLCLAQPTLCRVEGDSLLEYRFKLAERCNRRLRKTFCCAENDGPEPLFEERCRNYLIR